MKHGDFVRVDYVAKIKETSEIFDVTDVEIAKKEGIYDPRTEYGPVTLVVGGEWTIKGVEEALKEMKVGEKRTIEVPPTKAYGERRSELIKLIPASRFQEEPVPGAWVRVQGLRGRVLSVSGGRVRVDFNHPLAGKTLVYELKIREVVKSKLEKIKAIVHRFSGVKDAKPVVKKGEVEITFQRPVEVLRASKQLAAREVIRWIPSVKRVKFIDIFEEK